MTHTRKHSTGLTLLITGASIIVVSNILELLVMMVFLDYYNFLNFYIIQYFIALVSTVILIAGYGLFKKEFGERTSYAPKSVNLLITALILSLTANTLAIAYLLYEFEFLWPFSIFLSHLVSGILSLTGFVSLSKEFTKYAFYMKPPAPPTPIPLTLSTAHLRFCPSCGSQVFQDAAFCQNCGKKLQK